MENFICIKAYSSQEEAEAAKSRLDAEDIEANLIPDNGNMRLLVKKEDFKKAADVLRNP